MMHGKIRLRLNTAFMSDAVALQYNATTDEM